MSEQKQPVLSIDIGGATCKMGRVSPRGEVEEIKSYPTDEIREAGPEGFIERLNSLGENHPFEGITMGIPATVDWGHNHVRSKCEEVPWLEEASNKKKIQDAFHRPVLLMNDVEALLVGEWKQGELKGLHSGVVVSLGASMGSALLWNGTPQQGRRGSIMELEHVSLETYGEITDADPPGSAQQWLSGRGLIDRMKKRDLEVIDLPSFFEANRDPYVELRSTFVDKMAHLIGLIVMMLDPERIVLTGGLTGSHRKWLPEVKERMNEFVMEQFQGLPSVVLGQLRDEDVLVGPACFWRWKRETRNGS